MVNLFLKKIFSSLLVLLCLISSSLNAWENCEELCPSNRMYIGGFGGGIYSNSTRVYQMGTAFFIEEEGGPLAVLAKGHSQKHSTGYGGVQVGYEWHPSYNECSNWSLAPAGELEAFFYCHKKKAHLFNTTDRLPVHAFVDSFDIDRSVILVNAVLSINSNFCLTPYVGGGLGATRLSLKNAKSFQIIPAEPGVNHFNSKKSDSCWTFAAQVKAGLRFNIWKCFHIFGEYRYLFVDSSNYIFGSIVFPGHVATSPWNLKINHTHYNAFAVGIQYDL